MTSATPAPVSAPVAAAPHAKTPSSSAVLFFAGAASGIAEAVSVQPFDMIKTRYQLNEGVNKGVMETLLGIVRQEGVLRLYRGMTAEIIGMIPKTSALYASYELCRRYMIEELQLQENFAVCGLSGTIASIPEALIVTPSQVVKVRLQAKEHLGRYHGPVDCVMKIFRNEGVSHFFTGLVPTIYRNCVWNTIYFGVMFEMRKKLLSLNTSQQPQARWEARCQTFAAGLGGATLATCFNAPLDVIKSRFQSQVAASNGKMKYISTLQTLHLIWREEGVFALYKGFRPKVVRMGLGGAVAVTVFELVQDFAAAFS